MRTSFYIILVLLCSGCSISSVDTSHSVALSEPRESHLYKISEDPIVYRVSGTRAPVFLTKITRCDGKKRSNMGMSWRGLFAKFDQVAGSEQSEGRLHETPALKTLVQGKVDGEMVHLIALSTSEACAQDIIIWSFAKDPGVVVGAFDQIAEELRWNPALPQ